MLRVGVRAVRYYTALFAGSFLTMALGVALLGVTANGLTATWSVPAVTTGPTATVTGAGGTRVFFRDAVDLQGITTLLALAAVVSGFVMITSVAGTFAFSIALRRRYIGLLRLLGAGGWQVRRMILVEALAIALPAAAVGLVVAALVAPPMLRALSSTDLAPVRLPDRISSGALVFAYCVGVGLAVVAALLASSRAARVRPVEAMRDAVVDAQVMSKGRWVVGALSLTIGVVMMATAPGASALNSTPLVIFGTFALTIAATTLGPVYLPGVVRLVGASLRRLTGTAGRLAVASVATSRRRTASLASPVLGLIAVAGIMTGVMRTSDATGLADQVARSRAQFVVEPADGTGLDQDMLARIAAAPGVHTVSAPGRLKVAFATSSSPHGQLAPGGGSGTVDAEALDLTALAAVERLRVVEGSLTRLTGNQIAVRREFTSWYGVHAGSTVQLGFFDGRTVDARVAVIVDGGPGLAQIMLPPALAGAQAAAPTRAAILLDLPPADPAAEADRLARAVGADRVRVVPVAEWYATSAAAGDRLENIAMLVLVGPAALFTVVAVANSIAMAYSRRGREVAGMTLLGASRSQIRTTAVLEALLVAGLAVAVAVLFVVAGLAGYRNALRGDFLATALRVPWWMLGALAAGCAAVAVIASLLAIGRQLGRHAVMMATSREQ
jgi:putative ABC transport system permease protein